MSASARGLAISRAVDSCCKNLPAAPGSSPGATRFLQQWDRATRIQREELLHVLADRLLIGSGHGGPSLRLNQKKEILHADVHHDVDSQLTNDGEVVVPSLEPRAVSHPTRASLGPNNIFPSGLTGNGSSHQTGNDGSHSHPNDFPKKVCPVRAVVARTGSVVNGAKAENSPCHGKAQATASSNTMGERDVSGFLELLGPHAGLLAMRVSSQLRSSYASGQAVGPCLRVCALLAESTTGKGESGDADGDGYNVRSASSPSLVGQQLCTHEMISTALEIAAAAAAPAPALVVDDPNPTIKREKRTQRRQKTTSTKTAPMFSSSPTTENEEQEEGTDRREALRLLLALVRVGGRRVKEYLACPGRFSLPRTTDAVAASTLGSGDAFDRIVMALRRPACRSDVRMAGARLLVELALKDHHHPAGNSCGRVWNAVLCLLSGLGDEDPADGQILGCHIAVDLLAASPKPQGNRDDGQGPDIDALLGGSLSSQHQRQRRQRQMRPELMLLPSVLSLSLSDRREVRKAAGELAVLLSTDFPRPCCYLLVACLVGLFGLVSGVERGAPVAWVEHIHTPSRCRESVGMQDGDLHNPTEVDRSEMEEPGREHELEDDGRKTDCHAVYRHNLSGGNNVFRGQSSGAGRIKEESFLDSTDAPGAAGGQSTTTLASSFGSPPRTALDNKGTATHSDKAIFALDLLRRICTEGGTGDDKSVRLALAHALAPLAALDLVVGPASPLADNFSRYAEDTGNTGAGIDGTVFVTQTEIKAARVGAGCSDGGKNDVGGARPQFQGEEGMLQPARNHRLRGGGGPRSVSLQEELLSGCSGGERRLAGRPRCDCAQPTEAICRAVAEALLAMYRRGHGGRVAGGAGQPETGTLDLNGMIDAALDACPELSCGLNGGDIEAMVRMFSSCCSTSRGSCDIGEIRSVELATLRRNVFALTARLGRMRPPPAPPAPPLSPPAASAAASRSGAECDRPRVRHYHNRSDGREDGASGRKAATLSENERHANETEASFLGFSDRGDDEWRAATGREAIFSGEGHRDRMEPGTEGIGALCLFFLQRAVAYGRSAKMTTCNVPCSDTPYIVGCQRTNKRTYVSRWNLSSALFFLSPNSPTRRIAEKI